MRLLAVVLVGLIVTSPGSVPWEESLADIDRLIDDYRFDKARDRAGELLERVRHEQGSDSLAAAAVIRSLVEATNRCASVRDPKLVGLAEQGVAIREARLGADHVEVAASLHELAGVLLLLGRFEDAVSVQQRTLEVFERSVGVESEDYAESLKRLGRAQNRAGQRAEAIRSLEKSLEIRERLLGPDHPSTAASLKSLAVVLPLGDPRRITFAERSIAIFEEAYSPQHPEVGSALSNLGWIVWREGKFLQASRHLERSVEILTNHYGPGTWWVSSALTNLAGVRAESGDLAEARRLFEDTARSRERMLGPDHPLLAVSLFNLAEVYRRLGAHDQAQELLRRLVELRRRTLGEQHPKYANALVKLGQIQHDKGDLPAARRALELAVAIRERLEGEEGDLCNSLTGLAVVLAESGLLEEAFAVARRALDLQEKIWTADNLDIGRTLALVGSLHLFKGEKEQALAYQQRALQTFASTAGPQSEYIPATRISLTRTYLAMGRFSEALDQALTAEAETRDLFRRNIRTFSEYEALQFQSLQVSALDAALTAVKTGKLGTASTIPVFEEVIRSRALVMDEMATRHPAVLKSAPRDLIPLIEAVTTARSELSDLAVATISDQEREDYDEQLERARRAVEDSERALAAESRGFRERLERFSVGLAEVSTALPSAAALVSYMRFFHEGSVSVLPDGHSVGPRPAGYFAFVLRHGDRAPIAIHLGSAESIEDLVTSWEKEIATSPSTIGSSAADAENRYRIVGTRLRRAVWDPVERHLGGVELVFVVPDGALHQLTLAALPENDDAYLVERKPTLHYLSTERDLATEGSASSPGRGLLALGGPDFNRLSPMVASVQQTTADGTLRGSRAECEELRRREFPPLPGARAEARDVAELWRRHNDDQAMPNDVVLLTGESAGEHELKTLARGRRVVHLATHGFLSPAECGSILHADRSFRSEIGFPENPLLQAGIVLAGANRRENVDRESEDGMLTAQEIASLDLSSAEWVVLSACESGRGKIVPGEGVLGLRRAFEIAGAGTLIMSLWQVKDEPTREWMRELYSARLEGQSTAEAVRSASLTCLERRRETELPTHPYYWGAFVAAGDWR